MAKLANCQWRKYNEFFLNAALQTSPKTFATISAHATFIGNKKALTAMPRTLKKYSYGN